MPDRLQDPGRSFRGGCRLCGSASGFQVHSVPEMMFGTRVAFPYLECRACGSLQIEDVPADLARFYPADYYAKRPPGALGIRLRGAWMRYSLTGRGLAGRLLARLYGPHPIHRWVRGARLDWDSPILDVGCGDGRLLVAMAACGFTDLTGIDPFLDGGRREGGVELRRATLEEEGGRFDCVMFHHAFEHVPDPLDTLRSAAERVGAAGTILIRTPVAATHAWRMYGTAWVQLDAPRHLNIPSEEGMRRLAARVGLEVTAVEYDSTAFQFWGSELYQRGIAYAPRPAYRNRPSPRLIPRERMKTFARQAQELNARGDGDSACFYLRRARPADGTEAAALHDAEPFSAQPQLVGAQRVTADEP